MVHHHSCINTKLYLENLRRINRRAGAEDGIIDLIEAFARLRLNSGKDVRFYEQKIGANEFKNSDFLNRNLHLDSRVLSFLNAYFNEMERRELTCLINVDHLAHCLRISIPNLKQLANHRLNHYQQFKIQKNNGGFRTILAPKSRLKEVQRRILHRILEKIKLSACAEGFRKNRSILTNAEHHLNKKIVIKMDLKDFFPSITFKRIQGLFLSLGYPRNVSCTMAKLVTHDGCLPTGAPTSPALSNIITTRLDKRFAGLGKKTGFDYSRYADDMTMSGNNEGLNKMIPFFKQIIREEGFEVNESKTRILRSGRRQTVTGIVVNSKANIQKSEIKKVRAILFNCRNKKLKPEIKRWARLEKKVNCPGFCSSATFRSSMQGKINFINMVNPDMGEKLLHEFNKVKI